jgi:alpha-glucosidase
VAAPFNFEGLTLPWRASDWHRFLKSFHEALAQFNPHCVASYAFGNHDQPRLASRLGSEAAARSAAVLLLTLPGMAFIYYGDELGMTNGEIPPEFVQDPAAIGDPKHGIGRDPERTPMQWSTDIQAGFTTASRPWLPVSSTYKTHNVETESKDPQSFLSLYRKLANLRQSEPAFRWGSLIVIDTDHPQVLAYQRQKEYDIYTIVINFGSEIAECYIPITKAKVVLSSDPKSRLKEVSSSSLSLQPHEAILLH